MTIEILHGFFRRFLIPGFILLGSGIPTTSAFIDVLRRMRINWLLYSLALDGIAIWFIVKTAILQEFHWLHALRGLPVITGCLVVLHLIFTCFK